MSAKVHRGCGREVEEVSRKPLRYHCDAHGDLHWFEVTHSGERPTIEALRERQELMAQRPA